MEKKEEKVITKSECDGGWVPCHNCGFCVPDITDPGNLGGTWTYCAQCGHKL